MLSKTTFILLLPICMTSSSRAAQVVFSGYQVRSVTPTEVADSNGLLSAGTNVFDFYLTSDADILSIQDVSIDLFCFGSNGLYNHPEFGSNTRPPHPLLVEFAPAVGVDSWITTPGDGTSLAGGDLGDDNVAWFDTTDDGPVEDFHFARLTTTSHGTFSGTVSVDGSAGLERYPFHLLIGLCPEPTSLVLAGLSLAGILAWRRRSPSMRRESC